MKKEGFLPFALPDIGDAEIDEVVDSLRSGWLTTGPKTRRFESAFSEAVGGGHALAVNSATAGMHLALEAIGIGEGDKVVVPVYTFTATAEVVRYLGADPVFVDVDSRTLNIDLEQLRNCLESVEGIKAVMPVHFAGHPCRMDEINALAREFGVRVVEDAAHAFPAEYKGRMVGSLSDLSVFSFYATKTLATGEGGMIICHDESLVERMSAMRLHGISRDVFDRYTSDKPSWYYEVIAPGFKYNMTDVAASLGIHQLARSDELRQGRERIAERYLDELSGLGLHLPVIEDYCTRHSWHLFVVGLPEGMDRDAAVARLAGEGIGTSVHFIPLHLHPYWRDRYDLAPEAYPAALGRFQQALSLPIYTRMTDADVGRVIRAVKGLF